MDAQTAARQYPVRLSIDYPDRELNRATTFFRIIVAIPIFIVVASVSGWGWGGGWGDGRGYGEVAGAAGALGCSISSKACSDGALVSRVTRCCW